MSTKYIEVECSSCGKIMLREARQHKYYCKKFGPDYKPVCSTSCGRTKDVKCDTCGDLFKKKISCVGEHNFCNHSCAAKFTNKHRETPDVGTKVVSCRKCEKQLIASRHAKGKTCDDCREFTNKNRKRYTPKIFLIKRACIICNIEMELKSTSLQKYCNDCRKNRHKEIGKFAGKKSAAKQVRRSKNEIYFAELCEKEYKNVLTNEPFFDSKYGKWDADIILPNHKLAILWNGIWHYKQVRKNHSLKQVQSRDKIKEDIIKKSEYETYIISDIGKFDKEFVEEQFEYLRFFIKNKR